MRLSGWWLAAVVLATLSWTNGHAAVLYSQATTNTGIAGLGQAMAVTNPNINGLNNCLASEGCMGINVTPANSIPVQDFTLTFTVTAAQLAAISAGTGSGTLTVTAARDIGIRNGGTAPGTEFLIVTGEGTPLGNLYQNLISTASVSIPGACTTLQHNETPPVALDCGPNFDNDTTATESVGISQADFESFAADGTVSILIHPTIAGVDCQPAGSTCGVGRLKFFSAALEFDTIPEPSSIALIGIGLLGLTATKRLRKLCSSDRGVLTSHP
jgi:PEP-CTERM motif